VQRSAGQQSDQHAARCIIDHHEPRAQLSTTARLPPER
jgi:hypothetical protein